MYRNTRFNELMKGLPRGFFKKISDKHGLDKHSKGFSGWDQLIAMVYSQINDCKSLRELEAGFNSQGVHHYHLGTRSIKRSTLADANAKRNSEAFAEACSALMAHVKGSLKSDVGDLLYLMDSSPIPLKGLGYDDWTKSNKTHRTQGLKVHMVTVSEHDLPVKVGITAPNVNDIEWGRQIEIEKGATYAIDKGYCDYNWWFEIDKAGASFVTRFKKNAGVNVVGNYLIPEEVNETILKDELVEFKNKRPGGKRINHYYGTALRRITVARPDKDTPLIIATNDLDRTAIELAEIYKKRWGIELFFKWLKQNLKIKKFLGRNENAVKIQIYTAIITYLLVHLYHKRHGQQEVIRITLVTLKTALFQRPEIEEYRIRKKKEWDEMLSLQRGLAL